MSKLVHGNDSFREKHSYYNLTSGHLIAHTDNAITYWLLILISFFHLGQN